MMAESFPVKKAVSFTVEQWNEIAAYRFEVKIESNCDAVRDLVKKGLEAAALDRPPSSNGESVADQTYPPSS